MQSVPITTNVVSLNPAQGRYTQGSMPFVEPQKLVPMNKDHLHFVINNVTIATIIYLFLQLQTLFQRD